MKNNTKIGFILLFGFGICIATIYASNNMTATQMINTIHASIGMCILGITFLKFGHKIPGMS